MTHQCPFPVRSTDNRRSYRAGNAPGFILIFALIAVLSGYAGLSDAAPTAAAAYDTLDDASVIWGGAENPVARSATDYR
ncbi:MAG: hypothetical protein ACOY5S_13065 [Pseudomonadota bacterium]